MSIHFRCAFVLIALTLAGCNPPLHPLAMRLDADQQAMMDKGWNKLLADPRSADRGLMLDALVMTQLHHMGNDRFWYRAEKDIDSGIIVISSYFERTDPATDRIDVDVLDHRGLLVRRFSYTGKEVWSAVTDLNGRQSYGVIQPLNSEDSERQKTEEELQAEEQARRAIQVRRERVEKFFKDQSSQTPAPDDRK